MDAPSMEQTPVAAKANNPICRDSLVFGSSCMNIQSKNLFFLMIRHGKYAKVQKVHDLGYKKY
jgi:hypothetical protein